jgi:penicillin amidase
MGFLRQRRQIVVEAPGGPVRISRGPMGVPTIRADQAEGAWFGLGYMHAMDRLFQIWLTRTTIQGRLAEHLGAHAGLVEADLQFRRIDLSRAVAQPGGHNESGVSLQAYTAGVNAGVTGCPLPMEFRILGIRPDPWEATHTLALARLMGLYGLADTQGSAEKALTRIIRNDPSLLAIYRDLLSPRLDHYDPAWLEGLILDGDGGQGQRPHPAPEEPGSNNWVVGGKLTRSGRPILCNDPHLSISRLPAIWYEAAIETPDLSLVGFTIPGTPAYPAGWNGSVAWGITYAATDTIDYFIEDCRDGQFRRDGAWAPLRERREQIRVRDGEDVQVRFYENAHGVLEGDSGKPGRYLVRRWTGREPADASLTDSFLRLVRSRTVDEARVAVGGVSVPSLSWVFADSSGHIGYQMAGLVPKRPGGSGGVLPLPGWETRFDWEGFVPPERLPGETDPSAGFVVTANNRLTDDPNIQSLPFPSFRADTIAHRIRQGAPHDIESMKALQLDVQSLHARDLLDWLAPQLQRHRLGRRLVEWDCIYRRSTRNGLLFKAFYEALARKVCVGRICAEEDWELMYRESFLFLGLQETLERMWRSGEGAFADVDWDSVVAEVFEDLGGRRFRRWGSFNRLHARHPVFGRTLLSLLGLNFGPRSLSGASDTVNVAIQGRTAVVGPSFRMIVDLSVPRYLSVLAGGASGRPLSRAYKREFRMWLRGRYKERPSGPTRD